jgi:uncharacterized membrane protein
MLLTAVSRNDQGGSPMSENDVLMVLAASYDNVKDAENDYEAIKALYRDRKTSNDFDAAVIARQDDGTVKVVRKHEQPTRHGAARGLGWGLAIGAATALFPPVGLLGALAAGGAAGATIGAVRGHVKGGMPDTDLKELGAVLEKGQAGLIAVYETNLADQVAASIKAENRRVSKEIDARADELAKELHEVEAGS